MIHAQLHPPAGPAAKPVPHRAGRTKTARRDEHHELVALTLRLRDGAGASQKRRPPQDSARAVALVQPSHGIALLPAPEAPVRMPGISEEGGEEEEAF